MMKGGYLVLRSLGEAIMNLAFGLGKPGSRISPQKQVGRLERPGDVVKANTCKISGFTGCRRSIT